MSQYTLEKIIDLAVKTAVLKAKKEAILECRPIGSYFITETEDDLADCADIRFIYGKRK